MRILSGPHGASSYLELLCDGDDEWSALHTDTDRPRLHAHTLVKTEGLFLYALDRLSRWSAWGWDGEQTLYCGAPMQKKNAMLRRVSQRVGQACMQ